MQLVRVYSFTEGLSPVVQKAVEIAESLCNYATDEQVQEVLGQIPESNEYFTFVSYPGGYGTEILILCPLV